MRFAKWFGFYTLTCFLVGQIFYWLIVLLNTDFVYSIYPISWIGTFAGHPYGSFYRMFTYHYEYPVLYWWVMSFCFGIVATLWKALTFFFRPKLQVMTGILVIPLSILLASIPGSMLWAFHDWSAGRQH